MKLWTPLSRSRATPEPAARLWLHPPPHRRSWPLSLAPSRKQSTALRGVLLDNLNDFTSSLSLARNREERSLENSTPSQEHGKNSQQDSERSAARAVEECSSASWGSVYRDQLLWFAKKDFRAQNWAEHLMQLLDKGHTTMDSEALSLANDKSPTWIWLASAHWLVQNDLVSLLRLLEATHSERYISPTHAGGLLLRLARAWMRSKGKHSPDQVQRLVDVFCLFCHRGRTLPLRPMSQCIWTIMRYCTNEQVAQMYRAIKAHGVRLQEYSLMHFADRLAKHDYFEEGLDALSEAQKAGALVNDYPFRSCCSTLLRRSIEQPEGLRVCLRIVSTLVEWGLELNHPICDIIMLNAVEAGDLNTASSVYTFLKQRGLRPREGAIAALLKGCKMNIDNVRMLNETIRDAVEHLNVRKSELIACEILHCLALHHCKHHPNTALETLTEAYAQFFDLRALEKLGLPIPMIEQAQGEYSLPNQNALNIMIGVSIEQSLMHHSYSEGILPLYRRWRHLVEIGEPCYANLATSDYTANIFLMAFTQRSDGLVHATRVVRDMQETLPYTAGVKQAKPTVQTWSILLHGFARHQKTQMAEMVLRSMRSVGIEPNPVTWNSLMLGYARAQDEGGALDAVRRARESGIAWDKFTYGGLRALQQRERLEEELGSTLTPKLAAAPLIDTEEDRMPRPQAEE